MTADVCSGVCDTYDGCTLRTGVISRWSVTTGLIALPVVLPGTQCLFQPPNVPWCVFSMVMTYTIGCFPWCRMCSRRQGLGDNSGVTASEQVLCATGQHWLAAFYDHSPWSQNGQALADTPVRNNHQQSNVTCDSDSQV